MLLSSDLPTLQLIAPTVLEANWAYRSFQDKLAIKRALLSFCYIH